MNTVTTFFKSVTEILKFTPAELISSLAKKFTNLQKYLTMLPKTVASFVTYLRIASKKNKKLMRVILFSQDRVSVEEPEVNCIY